MSGTTMKDRIKDIKEKWAEIAPNANPRALVSEVPYLVATIEKMKRAMETIKLDKEPDAYERAQNAKWEVDCCFAECDKIAAEMKS